MGKRKNKSELKLRELKKWTKIVMGENKHIAEFLWVDGMYCRWKVDDSRSIIIMGHANQKVSEYGEIID